MVIEVSRPTTSAYSALSSCDGLNWLWCLIGNKIYVPDLELGILDSITRRSLIDIANETDLDLEISRIHIDDIYNVDTVFALSTAKHTIFVSKIDDQVYTQSPLLEKIRHSFIEFIEKERQLNK